MNNWTIQLSYGHGGIAVAFSGSEKFIEESMNFSINRLTRNIYKRGEVVYIHVKKRKFFRALILEGQAFAYLRGLRGVETLKAGKEHARKILEKACYENFMVKLVNFPRRKVFDEFSIGF